MRVRLALVLVMGVACSLVAAQLPPPQQGDLTSYPPGPGIWPGAVAGPQVPNGAQQANIDAAINLLCDLAMNLDTTQGTPEEQKRKRQCKKLLKEACDKYRDHPVNSPPPVFVGRVTGAEALTMPNSRDGGDTRWSPGDSGNLVAVDQYDQAMTGDSSGMDANGEWHFAEQDPDTGQVTIRKLDQPNSVWFLALLLFHEYFHCSQGLKSDGGPLEQCYTFTLHALIYRKQVDLAPMVPTPPKPQNEPIMEYIGAQRRAGFMIDKWLKSGTQAQGQAVALGWPVNLF